MHDEWSTVISGGRLVKFTYVDPATEAAFMTAQIAGHAVVYQSFQKRGRTSLQSRRRGRSLWL